MLPLGGAWQGRCTAPTGSSSSPDPPALRSLCNIGYARGACPHFPGGGTADAVRFTITADYDDAVLLAYVIESGHYPAAHGPLAWSRAAGRFEELPPLPALLSAQARAYVTSYLRRKADAAAPR